MIRKIFRTFLLVLALTSCITNPTVADERARRAEANKGDILIAIVEEEGLAWQAAQMAVDEINTAGGIAGRMLKVIHEDDGGSETQGRIIAQRLAANPDVVAVVGHNTSTASLPASAIYEFAGLLMISSAATTPRLTQQGFDLVFRNIPSDVKVGELITDYLAQQNTHNIVILSEKSAYGRGLGSAIETRAAQIGLNIVDRVSYQVSDSNFSEVIRDWKMLTFDAIVIAGSVPEAAYFIYQARQANLSQPILGGDGLITDELWGSGKAVNGTIIVSYFHPDDMQPEAVKFVEAFQKRFGSQPDVWAAQEYDAVKVLAYAMQQAGSSVPEKVAAALHQVNHWPGVTGPHSFDERGDVVGKPIVLIMASDKQFSFIHRFSEP